MFWTNYVKSEKMTFKHIDICVGSCEKFSLFSIYERKKKKKGDDFAHKKCTLRV